jgi:hypothetical protein
MSFISITGLRQYIFALATTWFIYAHFSPVAQTTLLIWRSTCSVMVLPVDLAAPLTLALARKAKITAVFRRQSPKSVAL